MADTVRAITAAGITVVGHIGLTPQSAGKLGGYRAGQDRSRRQRLLDDARARSGGGSDDRPEMVPDRGRARSQQLRIPTIGIGAGGGCDGQVSLHDLLGMFDRFTRFVKRYAELFPQMERALAEYCGCDGPALPAAEHVPDGRCEWAAGRRRLNREDAKSAKINQPVLRSSVPFAVHSCDETEGSSCMLILGTGALVVRMPPAAAYADVTVLGTWARADESDVGSATDLTVVVSACGEHDRAVAPADIALHPGQELSDARPGGRRACWRRMAWP